MRAILIAAILALAVVFPTTVGAHYDSYPHRANSTSYCDHGLMANEAYTAPGSVAMNQYRFGTKIKVSHPIFGKRYWIVRDRYGYGTQADFWTGSCAQANNYGRRNISYRVVPRGHH